MKQSGPELRSLPERLLGAAVLLLLAALALRGAVHLILSVFWPLLGIALSGLAVVGFFWVRRARRGGW